MKTVFRHLTFMLVILIFLSPLFLASPVVAHQAADQPKGFGWSQIGPAGGMFKAIVQNPFDTNMFFAFVEKALYKSLDNGFTWNQVPLPDGYDIRNSYIRLKIGGEDNPTLLLGDDKKLYRTLIDQIDWQEIAEFGAYSVYGYDFDISRKHSNIIFAVINQSFAITHDGGENWKAVFPASKKFAWNTINNEEILVFFNGVYYRTNDFGDTWRALGENVGNSYDLDELIFSESDGAYYSRISSFTDVRKSIDSGESWTKAFKTQNPAKGLQASSWNPDMFLISDSTYDNSYVTLDGGATWKSIPHDRGDMFEVKIFYLGKEPGDNSMIGIGNQTFMRINADNQEIQRSATGIHQQQIKDLIVNPQNGEELYVCMLVKTQYENNTICYFTPNTGEEWQRVGGTVRAIGANPVNFGEVYWIDGQGKSFFSPDYGATINQGGTVPTGFLPDLIFPNPHYPGKVMAYRSYSPGTVYISTDYGESWSESDKTVPGTYFAYDPLVADKAYCVEGRHPDNKLLITEDGGGSWQEVMLPPNNRFDNFLVRVIDGQSQLIVTIADHTLKGYISNNDGNNWNLRFELNNYHYPVPFDILESSGIVMNTVCVDCALDYTQTTIVFQTNFAGGWTYLPRLAMNQYVQTIKLVSYNSGFRLFISTGRDSVYYIDFSDKELMYVYLPLIQKR